MGFRITTNTQSLAALRTLGLTHESQNHSLEKLSSGQRIVRAADDAAGLAISEKLKAEIRSIKQANRNAQDGISLIQTAEGGLSEIQNILVRLRELSVQAASDTLSDVERGFTSKEVESLVSEVDRIAAQTRFNGIHLLDGQGHALEFQIGTHNDPTVDRLVYDVQEGNVTTEKLKITGMTVTTKEDAQMNLGRIDSAIENVSGNRATFGALQNRLQTTITNLAVADENLSTANSRIRDVDVASESSELVKANILAQAGTAMLAQANSNGMLALKLL